MAVIDHLDLSTKHIHLAVGVREYHPVDDVYREVRALRRTDETLRVFDMPVVASGNVAKGGGKFTPRLATFRNGWRVVPEDTSHTLVVTGEQITDDGQSGPAVIDFGPLSAASKVVVNYEPPSAEIIEVVSGSGVTEQDKIDIAEQASVEVWSVAEREITGTAPGAIEALSFAVGALDAAALSLDAGQEIADRVLARSLGVGADGGRTVQDALRLLRNRVSLLSGLLTVYEEDDATPAWSGAVSTAERDAISVIDPT